MKFNSEIVEALKSQHIDQDEGLLCLLAIYHGLNADKIVSAVTIKKINLTHIVDKDYSTGTIQWNIPLFEGQVVDSFDWVGEWMQTFGDRNPARRGVKKEVMIRMKNWFAENPEYRKEDVFKARDMYFRVENPEPKHVKTSYKFIKEGSGATATSQLLMWCERVREIEKTSQPGSVNPLVRGTIIR